MKIATRLLFALTILGGCSAMSAKSPRLKSPKSAFGHGSKRKEMRKTQDLRKQSYMLLHSLADLDLGTALTENVGSKIVTVATKVANLTAASTHDDFAKLLPASGENDFTKLVAEYSLFDRGAFRYLVRPKRQLKDLQILVKEVAQASSNGDQPVKEFQDLQELWSVISKKFDAATQKAFLQSTTDALEILVKAYAARAAEAVKSKPHATDAQKKLLTDSTEILKESNSAASAFNDSVMIELGVKDPESANTMLKPMYEAIPDIAFLGRALMQWPEAFATPKESLELLHLAQCAYQINNRIQGVVTKMRNRTLFRARRSLREVSFHLTQLQETLNEVTDNVGPFKKASGDLVSAAEPVIQDLEALKKSITTLIQKLSEETKAQGHAPAISSAPTPAAPTPTIPAPTPAPVTPPAPAPVSPVPSPEHAPAPVPTPGV